MMGEQADLIRKYECIEQRANALIDSFNVGPRLGGDGEQREFLELRLELARTTAYANDGKLPAEYIHKAQGIRLRLMALPTGLGVDI